MAGKWESAGHPGVEKQPILGTKDYRYRARFRDARGKVTSKTFLRFKDARDFLGDMRIRRRTGDLPDTSRATRTLSTLWAEFAKKREQKSGRPIKPSTWPTYEHRWRNWIEPALGKRRLNALNASDIESFYDRVEGEGSFDTRRKVQQVLRRLLEFGVEKGWIVKNPAAGIYQPGAEPQREPRPLTEAEVEKIANEVPPRYRAFVWTLAETGARPGEVTALRVKNLNGTIRIAEATTEVGGRKITGTPKTKGSIRNIPISPRLRQELDDHFEAGFRNRYDLESYVFTSDQGVQISQSNFRNRVLIPAAERVGITGFTTYDFRHTAISLWLMRGLSAWDVFQDGRLHPRVDDRAAVWPSVRVGAPEEDRRPGEPRIGRTHDDVRPLSAPRNDRRHDRRADATLVRGDQE